MRCGIVFLVLWLVIALGLAGSGLPVNPPGGMHWPVYLFAASIPFGAMFYARYPGKLLFALLYGLIAGAIFALPIFMDEWGFFAETVTVESVMLKIGAFVCAMSLACAGGYGIGRRLFKRDEVHAA